MSVVAVVGNPRTPSRTRAAASCLLASLGAPQAPVYDLAEPDLQLGLASARPGEALQAALQAVAAPATRLAVFATPTYKAAYTGLLKCLLDLLPPDALAGKLAVPLMLGAGEGHRLAVEHTLKPVLIELGAVCPPRGLYLLDAGVRQDPPSLAEPQQLELERFVERLRGMWSW